MLCVKCHTAIAGDAKNCSYCGAKTDKNRTRKAAFLLFAVLLSLTAGSYYYAERGIAAYTDETANQPQDGEQNTAAQNTGHTLSSPEEVLNSPETRERTQADITIALMEAVISANQYQSKRTNSVFVTNRGYLYNNSEKIFVTIHDIEKTKILESIPDGILLLYLRTADLAGYSGLDIIQSQNLVIFAAYEIADGFVLKSENNGGGVLPREDLSRVLAKYESDNGAIRKIEKDSDDYNQISMLIGNLYNGRDSFNFHYLYKDDVYCVAVTSSVANPNIINGHILYLENDTWYPGFWHYETHEKPKAAVNAQFTDLNLELVPEWSLVPANTLRTNYPELIRLLRQNGMISADETVTLQSGTDEFCYIETESGLKYIGFLNQNGKWDISKITSYEQAVRFLENAAETPPLYILKQFD